MLASSRSGPDLEVRPCAALLCLEATVVEPGLQERVARLEGRVQDFGDRFDTLERRLDSFERRMDARCETVDRRFQGLDQRFETIDQRFGTVDRRFVVLEAQLHALDDKMSSQFRWLVGGQVAVLVSIVGTLSAALFLR